MAAPVHHDPTPQTWIVWWGTGVYVDQLGLGTAGVTGSIPGLSGVLLPMKLDTPALRAYPFSGLAVAIGDPYYGVQTTGAAAHELGALVNVVENCTSDRQALAAASSIAGGRQFLLENGIYGHWIETIRPRVQSDDSSSISTAPDGSQYKSGVIDITDGRYWMSSDHHWHNRNHPDVDLGWAASPAQEPESGISGFVQGVSNILSAGFADLVHNPLGAALLVLVLVSAAPLGGLFLPAVEVTTVAAESVDLVTGGSAGALAKVESGAKFIAEHPAETGEAVAGAELIVAGAAVGGKFGKALAGAVGGKVLEGGLGGLLGAAAAPDVATVPQSPSTPQDLAAPLEQREPWWRFFTRSRSSA